MVLSRLVNLPISSLRNLDIKLKNMIELIDFMMQHFLPGVTQHALWPYVDMKLIILNILSKFNLSTMGLNS